jgi:hypothetical protein
MAARTPAKSRAERLFSRLINAKDNQLEKIVDKTLELAANGDQWAAKAIFERVFPIKGRTIQGLNLSGADPVGAVDRVLQAV